MNLATEKTVGSAVTSFELKDEDGNAVSASAYTETDFSFLFKDPFNGTLTLQNDGVPDASMTYHITAEECASEPPTPPTTKTDTLYFEFELEAGASSSEIQARSSLPGIVEIEYYDGEAHSKFSLNDFTVNGNGYGRIYCTYEPGESYTAAFTSGAGILVGNSDIAVVSLVSNITSLDVSGCTALEELSSSFNHLTSLNVSGCTALKKLWCDNNRLTTLDLNSNTALKELWCNDNRLTTLGLNNNPDLKFLMCGDNHIPLSTLHGIYSQQENWNTFNASNQTDNVSLSACEALNLATEKMLGGTATTFTLSPNIASTAYTEDDFSFVFNDAFNGTLTLQNASVPSASMTYHITAEECVSEPPTPPTTKTDTLYFEFELEEGETSATIEYNFSNDVFSGIEMEYNDGEAHPKFSPEASGNITVTGNGHGWIYYTYEESAGYSVRCSSLDGGSQDIQMRTLTGVSLTALDVHACPVLTLLRCSDNQLTALDVSGCTALEELYCDQNQLTALDVSGNTDLKVLSCGYNSLTELDVRKNSALLGLYCSNNQLTALDISGNVTLVYLECNDNRLTALDISGNVTLLYLVCNDNRLTELTLGENSALMGLVCWNNHIPLSILHGIYSQRSDDWVEFVADPQSDTLAVAMCRALDLSSESPLGGVETAYELKDEAGNEVSAGAYTENGFVFQFNTPATYTLSLENSSVPSASMTYHITTEECLSVSVSANNEAWGWATQTGNGTYERGADITVIATPRDGYRFVNWTKEGEEISIYAVYTFAVTEDLALVANFEAIPEEPVEEEMFTLHILANDAAWGSVSQSGNGTYKKDSLATVIATPNEGYRFVNWLKEGVSVFATAADTTFAVTENLILIAHFEKIPDEPLPVEEGFTVTLTPNNSAWGMVFKTGNCIYSEGAEIKILALPFAGYRFVNWPMPDGSV
ncbi:MAG: hypothetical protein K2H68_00500, partial [Bacteroidales bacterium]|nr:hypothetical protein [Bacteroidales bacterium]